MKTLILLLLISVSGCAVVDAMHSVVPPYGTAEKERQRKAGEESLGRMYASQRAREAKQKADEEAYDQSLKRMGAPTLAERNQVKPENPQYTACIYYGNAYVQAINIRNQWGFSDAQATYNAILGHVKAVLSDYPQFSPEGIVDNVLYNPALRPPVGGNPFMLQIVQLCMDETKRLAIKP